jgi:hypothetical protein
MPSGKKFILCITDDFSKYQELVTVPGKNAPTLASALFSRWFCRHGLSLEIVLDNGREFCNEIVDTLLNTDGYQKDQHNTISPTNKCKSRGLGWYSGSQV